MGPKLRYPALGNNTCKDDAATTSKKGRLQIAPVKPQLFNQKAVTSAYQIHLLPEPEGGKRITMQTSFKLTRATQNGSLARDALHNGAQVSSSIIISIN